MSLRTFRRYSELRLTMLQGCFRGLHWGPVYDVSHCRLVFPDFSLADSAAGNSLILVFLGTQHEFL